MKTIKLLLIAFLVLNCSLLYSQEVYIYDESGNKLYFQKTESVKFVSINPSSTTEQRERIKQNLKKLYANNLQEKTPLLYRISLNTEQEAKLLSELQRDAKDLCISPMLMYADSTVQWTSNEIIVKIFPDASIETVLNKHSIQYKKTRQLGSNLQTFVVTLTGVEDSTIKYANLLYESGNVVFAQPSFWRLLKPHNTFYPQQWGLNNTGQYGGTAGIDINAPEAWQLSTGAGIKVAVIDEGVDLSHPDLNDNLLPGYDATDGSLGGGNGSPKGNDAHGTACAGIIAAEDNSEGVKGVAYNAKIIPVRISYRTPPNDGWVQNDAWIVDGIYHAWYHKQADVLSNSWGGGSNSVARDNEINAAVTQGRNGKGCVVVFSTGNYNTTVAYPATLPNVIAVGAISPCGQRKSPTSCDGETTWGSNYGAALDVVAPGVKIYTTDIQGSAGYTSSNYHSRFNGTSATCPHVAGVAALILSFNPNLTQAQVRKAIESSCTKLSGYSFSGSSAHPNGTWNNQVGYGLVNARAALEAVLSNISISGPVYACSNSTSTFTLNNIPSNIPVSWTVSSDLQIVGSTANYVSVQKKSFSETNADNWVQASFLNHTVRRQITVWRSGIQDYMLNQEALQGYAYCSGGDFSVYYPSGRSLDGSNFTWMNSCDWTPSYQGYQITSFSGNDCGAESVYITVNFTDVCNGSSTIYKSFDIECYSTYSAAYPNPASTELTIDKTEDTNNNFAVQNSKAAAKPSTVKVLLYSHGTTKLVYSKDYSSEDRQIKIDTSKLPNGVYYLNIIENGEKIKEQTIVINH